jgi:small-conductance mechanosensitive channel
MESSSIRIRISYIVYDHEQWHAVSCQVKEMIYKRFAAEGIKIPHNIIDVHTE